MPLCFLAFENVRSPLSLAARHSYLLSPLTAPDCVVYPADPDEVPTGAGDVTNFRRGLAPCVFVPWECVATSVLNLPVKDMDYWMPG
jgi:hypothetical protein